MVYLKSNIKKIAVSFLAIVFCYVVCCTPFYTSRKVKAIAPAVAMLAYSALVSVAMIGLHVNPDGETNFQKAGEAVVDQFKADFIQKYPFDDPVNGTVYRTRLEDLISAWQEGVVDITSPAYQAFREWAFETYLNSQNSNIYGDNVVPFSNGLQLLSSSKYSIYLSNSNLLSVVPYGSFPYLSYSISLNSSSSDLYSNYFYLSYNGSSYYLWSRFYSSNISISDFYIYYVNSSGSLTSNKYSRYYIYGSWIAVELKDFSSNNFCNFDLNLPVVSLSEFSSNLPQDIFSKSDFTLSLDSSEVYQQVKEIADREISGTSTQDLIDRAKYLNDMVKQVPQDGSDYINLRKYADEYGGDIEAAAEDLLTGTRTTSDVQQGVNVDTTVQGQVVDNVGTPAVDLATPTTIAQSVPLVVTPDLSIVLPQEFTYPNRYGGEFSFPLSQYFPFCMPFDAVKILRLLNSPARAPKIEVPLNGIFANFWNINYNKGSDGDLVHIRGDTMTLDLSRFNAVAAICRTLLYLLFLVGVGFGIRSWLHGGD